MNPFEIAIGLQPIASLEVAKKRVGQVNPRAHRMTKIRNETFEKT